MSLKGTPYYDMALDAGASKGDEAEQMAQMIQADHWESQFEDEGEDMMWLDEIEEELESLATKPRLDRAITFVSIDEALVYRMVRVLRELVMGVKQARVCFELLRDARQIKGTTFDEWFENMSDDAKELMRVNKECVIDS